MYYNLICFFLYALLFAQNFILVKSGCYTRGVQVVHVTWRAATRIVAGVGDLVQRIGDDQAQVEYLVARRLRGRVTPCAVSTVHEEIRSAGFLVEPKNQDRRFPNLGLKTGSCG
jgi:hypothetical protein